MYALPELASLTEAWWAALRRHLWRAGAPLLPERPEEGTDLERLWLSPKLLLAQTCGYPLTHRLKVRVRYVATFCYGAAGCRAASYCSFILVRSDDPASDLRDLRGRRAVINSWDSHSGMNALRHAVAPLAKGGRFFTEVEASGSHRASLCWLKREVADVAAVDCVTLSLLERVAPAELQGLRCLARSEAAPGLPLITRPDASQEEVEALRRGLASACADPELEPLRIALLLTGMEVLPPGAYDRILEMEQEAVATGYSHLR